MNYQRIYAALMAHRRLAPPFGVYSESHHVLPRCMGGTDDLSNLVALTAREHFIAHQLLAKIYPTNRKLAHAAWRMSNFKRYGARRYAWLKVKWKKTISLAMKGRKPWCAGKRLSVETRAKMSASKAGRSPHNKGKSPSPETCAKISRSLAGKRQTQETINKRRHHLIGNRFAVGLKNGAHIVRLASLNKGRKMDAAVVAKRWETRRTNQAQREASV